MLSELSKKFPELREKILSPFLVDVNPNYISLIAFASALVSGYLFYEGIYIYAALFLFINGFMDVLDGEIAKKFGKAGKIGDLIDHTFDRLADIAILMGLSLSIYVPRGVGLVTIIAVLLVSYMGTQAHALTNRRLYSGILGRSDRILILIIAAVLTQYYITALAYAVILILVLSIITFFQRLWGSYKMIKG